MSPHRSSLFLACCLVLFSIGCGSQPSNKLPPAAGPTGFVAPATVTPPTGYYTPTFVTGANGALSGSILVTAAGSTGAVTPATYLVDNQGGLLGLKTDKAGNFFALEIQTVAGNPIQNIVEFYSPDPATAVRRIATTSATIASAIAVDPSGNIAAAANGAINFYAPLDNGTVTPERTITGPLTQLGNALSMTFDSAGNLYVLNLRQLLVFPAGASGNVAPTVVPTQTLPNYVNDLVSLDSRGNVGITSLFEQDDAKGNPLRYSSAVSIYAAGLTPKSVPISVLTPSLNYVFGELAYDSGNNLYISALDTTGNGYIVEFAAGASGTATPTAVLSSAQYKTSGGSLVVR